MSRTTAAKASDANLDLPDGMFRTGGAAEKTVIAMNKRKKTAPLNSDATFTEIDGLAIFEGDIILGTADEARGVSDPGAKGLGITGKQFRWPRGVVPYVTQPALRNRVEQAIAHWEAHTSFRFPKRTTAHKDSISFEAGGGCSSRVGRQGGEQVITLGDGCTVGSTIHEIGHALGLWHEQSRSDRDDFITIVWENISPQQQHNFKQHIQDGDDLGIYDHGSIMHYPAKAFSINDKPTIIVKGGKAIGQRNGLSKGDVAAIRLLYPNLKWKVVASPNGDV